MGGQGMLLEPQTRISKRALKVWQFYGIFHSIIAISLVAGLIILTSFFDWPVWIVWAAIVVAVIFTFVSVILLPKLRWNRWRYEVREQEIELQHGVFITRRRLIPMVRVQHIDTSQGPILKRYHLATVAISTAATIHEIPALDVVEAEELRIQIGKLARVADEDV